MKLELEHTDIEAIASRIAEILRPTLARNGGDVVGDTIFDVRGLAEYLKVSKKWIYEHVQFKEIPHFKLTGQLRFSRKDIDKWMSGHKIPTTTV